MSGGLAAAFGWGSAQAAVRMVIGFASIKVTAVLLGPSGIALVGQVGNFLTLLQGTLGNAIQTAVTKITAQEEGAAGQGQQKLWGTATRLALGLAVVVGSGVALLSLPLARSLLGREDLWPVFVLAGLVLPVTMLQLVLTGVLTGLRRFRQIAFVNMGATVLGAVIFIGLTLAFGLIGGLAGTLLAVASALLVTLLVLRGDGGLRIRDCFAHWRPELVRPIVAFYPMLLVHAAAEPATLLLVRDALIDSQGVALAGQWQATLRLSNMFTMVLVTTLSMYALPTLSAIGDAQRFRSTMYGIVFKVAALTAGLALAIYVLRDPIVRVVFTAQFLPMRDLLGTQLVGDVLNMACWPLQAGLMAQNRAKTYMAVEVLVAAVQIGLTHMMLTDMGLSAATTAYAVTWGVAMTVLVLLHWRVRDHGAPASQA